MESEGKKVIRVGSRKSELALIQTNYVIDCLKKIYHDIEFTIVTMTTLGDRILDISLPKIGEKSLFTKDLEDALRNDTVDFVVHSLKDLPTTLPEGLAIGAVFEREDPRDALVLREDLKEHTLATLPEGSVIGTSSLRRTAQLRGSHPHLQVLDVRGNLNTRLKKLDASGGPYSGLLLAKSGMSRMKWDHRVTRVLPCSEMLYAVGQGALAAECRAGDAGLRALLAPLSHAATYCRALAERSFLRTLGGGCSAPVGVSTSFKQTDDQFKLSLAGAVWSLDGATCVRHSAEQLFKQINKSVKHKLSPDDEDPKKKLKSDTFHPLQALDDMVAQKSSCEDTRSEDEIKALRSEVRIHCGMTQHASIIPEVIEKCELLGKELAEVLIAQGALEVMKVTQDLIRSSVGDKISDVQSS